MNIGNYQQELKDSGINYVLNEVQDGMQVIAAIENDLVIKSFCESGSEV